MDDRSRLQLDDDLRGPAVRRDPARALRDLAWRQQVNRTAVANRLQVAWQALPPPVQYQSWLDRQHRTLVDPLTPWEQYATAIEAQERATLLLQGGRRGMQLPATYVEVETVPPAMQGQVGTQYEYRVWSEELVRDPTTYRGRAWQPQEYGRTSHVTALAAAVARAPRHPPDDRVVVFSDDQALRAALRAEGVILGPRYSPHLAQERRQFYTQEAKQAVAEARVAVADIEAVWQTYSPAQQRRAYLDAGQGPEPTLWEQRLAAHTRLDRRQRMIPQASRDGELPAAFVEVEHGQPDAAPYAVSHWTRIWDADLGVTRYAPEATVPTWRIDQVAERADARRATVYADDLRLQAQLQHHGLAVADTPHLAAQPPYRAHAPEHERERGRGVGE